jgi:hypothetical protein
VPGSYNASRPASRARSRSQESSKTYPVSAIPLTRRAHSAHKRHGGASCCARSLRRDGCQCVVVEENLKSRILTAGAREPPKNISLEISVVSPTASTFASASTAFCV